jgi:hypothetical protein
MKKILITVLVMAGISATAQVKVGSNPTTIDTGTTNFQVEGTTTAEQFVVLKNGNVGIGTTTPTEKLHVLGNGRIESSAISGSPYLTFYSKDGSLGTIMESTKIVSSAETINGWGLALHTKTQGGSITEKVRITNNGNVGIGTTTPTEKLEVNGNIKLTSTYNSGISNNSGSGIARYGTNMPNLLTTGVLASQGGFISFDSRAGQNAISLWVRQPNSTTENQALVVSNTGNVGIGTTVPTSKLQVVGLPVHATNAAAITAGLTAGAFYHAGDGIVRVVF